MEKTKKFVLLICFGVALFYFSAIPFYSGSFLGYVIARCFSGKSTALQGKLKSITFDIWTYRVHLHHWLISGLVILFLLIKGAYSEFILGCFGFSAAVVFHGIYYYPDWYKVWRKLPANEDITD